MTAIEENYRRLVDRVGDAAVRSGRSPAEVRVIGVTKTVDLNRVREAIDCGLSEIGENRIQEAESKIPLLDRSGVTCHMIGHLQSNKVRKALKLFSIIQTVDSIGLVHRLDQLADTPVGVLIQVKLGDEATKAGALPADVGPIAEAVRRSENLELRGLMGIPPLSENPEETRPYFEQLKRQALILSLPEVSMGMSRDFEVAIAEGATMVRVGRALFGERRVP